MLLLISEDDGGAAQSAVAAEDVIAVGDAVAADDTVVAAERAVAAEDADVEELLRVLLLLMRPMMDLKILLLLLLGMNIVIAVFYRPYSHASIINRQHT